MWGKRHCRCTTPDGTPSIRTPSGVFSCYPLMARSKAREESCPYSPECVEGDSAKFGVASDPSGTAASTLRRHGGPPPKSKRSDCRRYPVTSCQKSSPTTSLMCHQPGWRPCCYRSCSRDPFSASTVLFLSPRATQATTGSINLKIPKSCPSAV